MKIYLVRHGQCESNVIKIENTQPNGWVFSMVGREGLEPPTSSV